MSPAGNKIDVSVIIVNYNTRQLTLDCIASIIEKTSGISFEIILVDNASSDDSVHFIKQQFPSVHIVQNNQNEGFGRANNTGAKHARGEFLFLLNSDTVLLNNAIQILTGVMRDDRAKTTGISCSNFYTGNLQPNHSYFQYYPTIFTMLLYKTYFWKLFTHDTFNDTGKIKEVAMIIGAHLFIRKNVFDSLDGFDPNFFMYLEDSDLCLRVKKAGYKLVSVPAARIIHYQGKSSVIGSKLIMEATSFIYYFRKHGSRFTVFCYKAIELGAALVKAVVFIFNPQRRAAYLKLAKFLIS